MGLDLEWQLSGSFGVKWQFKVGTQVVVPEARRIFFIKTSLSSPKAADFYPLVPPQFVEQ